MCFRGWWWGLGRRVGHGRCGHETSREAGRASDAPAGPAASGSTGAAFSCSKAFCKANTLCGRCQRIDLQAPAHHLYQFGRIDSFQLLEMALHAVVLLALVGRLRRRAHHAGEDRRADAVDISPRPQVAALGIQLRRRKARRVHRRELGQVAVQGLARRAEIEQDRRAVDAQVDIGRFQVEVQQLVGMHFAQAVHDLVEHLADEAFRYQRLLSLVAAAQDMFLQRVARFIGHHHVDRFIGAEKIHHRDHVRMGDARQRPPFLEKTFQADAEDRQVFRRNEGHQLARLAQRQRAGQIFLDRDRIAIVVIRQIYNTEPAGRNLLYNAISTNIQPIRQGCIVLRGHIFPKVIRLFGLCG